MKVIDGSQGEGGGQILRSALALSMCTQTPIKIHNIRAGRKKPGLSRQHLICVQASQAICKAEVSGAELGSQSLTFAPGDIQSGEYEFSIGTAGSTCLVFQTVLPALLLAKHPSSIRLKGGTHNSMAPSFDFIERCFIPTLRLMNIHMSTELTTYGFQPVGGGSWSATIEPMSAVSPLKLAERGEIQLSAVVTQAGLNSEIAEQQLGHVQKKLGLRSCDLDINQVTAPCSGNVLSLRLKHADDTAEVIDSIGGIRSSAKRVADLAVDTAQRYLRSTAVVGEHLCDQLLLPMALGSGGRFTTLKPTMHTLTNIDVIQTLLDCEITVKELDHDCFEVQVSK